MSEECLSRKERQQLHGPDYVSAFEGQTPRRLIQILQYVSIPVCATVADFGCGNGKLLSFIYDSIKEYIGVDFSDAFIDIAKRRKESHRFSRATFYCGSILDFCKDRPNMFDVVFAFDLSEHIYDEEWQEIVSSMHFVLKPGGKTYVHTPNRDFFVEIMKERNIILRQMPEHIAVRNAEQNVSFFERSKFANISVRYLPHHNVLRHVHFLCHLPLMGRYCRARILLTATK